MEESRGTRRKRENEEHSNTSLTLSLPPPHTRRRRHATSLRVEKADTIESLFPWATDRRATVHSLKYLTSRGILLVEGMVQCKMCNASKIITYNVASKFLEVAQFIMAKKHVMHDRAPSEWMNPSFPECETCMVPNSMRPVISPKKRSINWLFLFLGQMLGCCTLEQLKYFCKHTKRHRTGAKDRVLYLTYLGISEQLDPLRLLDLSL